MSLARRVLRRIYPAHDELAVYSMALGLGFLVLFDQDFATLLGRAMYEVFVVLAVEKFDAGWWDGIVYLFGMAALFLCTAYGLIASVYLPFTRRRFDLYVVFVIMAHAIMMCVANIVLAQQDGGIVNWLIAGGSLLWLLGYFACLREHRVDYLTERQASKQEAWIAGIAVFGGIAICSLVLQWHWANCYAFSFVSAVALTHGARTMIGQNA